jgi:hypothetical protein
MKDNVSQSEELVIIRTNSNPNLIDNENSLEDNTINDKVSHFAILTILCRDNLLIKLSDKGNNITIYSTFNGFINLLNNFHNLNHTNN